MNLESIVKGYLTNAIADKLATKLGIAPATARSLVNKAVPLFLGSMAKNAGQDQSAAEGLFGAITKDHDGSIFANLEDVIANPKNAKGDKILSHVFGSNEGNIEKALAASEGVDTAQAKDLMQSLAPMVMGALGKEQSEKHLEADHLSKMFAEEQRQVQAQKANNPLLSLIDKEGDGVADDLLNMGMSFLKNRR